MGNFKQRVSLHLTTLLALHLANNLALPLLRFIPFPWRILADCLVQSIGHSQPFLLAIWAVFGNGSFAIRIPRTVFALVLLSLSPAITLSFPLPDSSEGFAVSLYLISSLGSFLSASACFAFLNLWLMWRIVRVGLKCENTMRRGERTFTLKDLLWQIALGAIVFTACRSVPVDPPMDLDVAMDFLWRFGIDDLVFLPIALTVLRVVWATNDRKRSLVLSLVVLAIICGWEGRNDLHGHWTGMTTSVTISIAFYGALYGSLSMVRLAGFRLVRVPEDFTTA